MREVLLLLLLAAPLAAAADDYGDALAGARLQAEQGHYLEAAQALEGPSAAWPQDFQLQLARAYYLLRAGAYAAAEDQYRVVLGLAPDSPEARRGLADAQLGRGAPSQAWLGLHGAGTTYSGASSRASLGSGAISLDAQLADRWLLGALYRGLGSSSSVAAGGRGRGSTSLSLQHEGHLTLGLVSTGWEVRLHGAAIGRSASVVAGVEQVSGHGGVAAGVSALARWGLEWRGAAVTSWYEDLTVTQLEGTATLPLGEHLALRAGARAHLLGGGSTGAALLAVEWRGPLSLTLAGEYGAQWRPADLDGRVLYNGPDELRWAGRLQASLPLGRQVRAWLGADLEGWRSPAGAVPAADGTATRLAAGLLLSF